MSKPPSSGGHKAPAAGRKPALPRQDNNGKSQPLGAPGGKPRKVYKAVNKASKKGAMVVESMANGLAELQGRLDGLEEKRERDEKSDDEKSDKLVGQPVMVEPTGVVTTKAALDVVRIIDRNPHQGVDVRQGLPVHGGGSHIARGWVHGAYSVQDPDPPVVSVVNRAVALINPDPPAEQFWADFEECAVDHFVKTGYNEAGLKLAFARSLQWMQRCGKTKPPGWSRTSNTVIVNAYYNRWKPVTYIPWLWCMFKDNMFVLGDKCIGWLLDWLSTLEWWQLVLVCFFILPPCLAMGAVLLFTPLGVLLVWYLHERWQMRNVEWPPPERLEVERVADWCPGTFEEVDIAPDAKIKLPLDVHKAGDCVPRTYLVGITFIGRHYWVPRGCIHNEWVALSKRQLLPPLGTPEIRRITWKANGDALAKYWGDGTYSVTKTYDELIEQFICRYPIRRRKAIMAALVRLDNGHCYFDEQTIMFVKIESNVHKAVEKRHARAISSQSDDFLGVSAPIYYDWLKHTNNVLWPNPDVASTRRFIYMAGFNSVEIGQILTTMENLGYDVYSGDLERNDGHTEIEAIDAELDFCRKQMPVEFVDTVMVKFRETRGRSMHGIKYQHKAKVNSGGINTGGGNTQRSFAMCAGFFDEHYPESDWKVGASGDDILLFTRIPGFKFEHFEHWAWKSGHRIEITPVTDYDHIDFLSSRPWDIGGVRVMVPKLGRFLAKAFMNCKSDVTHENHWQYIREVASSYKNIFWFPGVSGLCQNILKKTEGLMLQETRISKHSNPYRIQYVETPDVDIVSVEAQFTKVYGMDPRALDRMLSNIDLQLGSFYEHPMVNQIMVVDGCLPEDLSWAESVQAAIEVVNPLPALRRRLPASLFS